MITPSGTIEPSKKRGKAGQVSRKKKARADKGRERAIEVEGKMEMKVREREERKVSCGLDSSRFKSRCWGFVSRGH